MTHPQPAGLIGCWDQQGATAAGVAATTTAAAVAVEAPVESWPEQGGWVRVCTCDHKARTTQQVLSCGVSLQRNSSIALQANEWFPTLVGSSIQLQADQLCCMLVKHMWPLCLREEVMEEESNRTT